LPFLLKLSSVSEHPAENRVQARKRMASLLDKDSTVEFDIGKKVSHAELDAVAVAQETCKGEALFAAVTDMGDKRSTVDLDGVPVAVAHEGDKDSTLEFDTGTVVVDLEVHPAAVAGKGKKDSLVELDGVAVAETSEGEVLSAAVADKGDKPSTVGLDGVPGALADEGEKDFAVAFDTGAVGVDLEAHSVAVAGKVKKDHPAVSEMSMFFRMAFILTCVSLVVIVVATAVQLSVPRDTRISMNKWGVALFISGLICLCCVVHFCCPEILCRTL